MTLSALIDEIQLKVIALQRTGQITRAMGALLETWTNRLREQVQRFGSLTNYEQEERKPWIAKSFRELELVVIALATGRRSVSAVVSQALEEAIRMIHGSATQVEALVVQSPTKVESLQCDVGLDNGSVGFVLFLSPVVDYTSHPLLPRVIHEAAHSDRQILAMTDRNSGFIARKTGEATCDMVALLLAGPAYVHSTVVLIQRLGAEVASRYSWRHPSLTARKEILSNLVLRLWPSGLVSDLARQLLEPVASLDCPVAERTEVNVVLASVVGYMPQYSTIAVEESEWTLIYQGKNPTRQSSILVQMNMDLASQRLTP